MISRPDASGQIVARQAMRDRREVGDRADDAAREAVGHQYADQEQRRAQYAQQQPRTPNALVQNGCRYEDPHDGGLLAALHGHEDLDAVRKAVAALKKLKPK